MFKMRHDIKRVHFYSLCEKVKTFCGFELISVQDAERLSEQITVSTGKRLSASTLYRLLISEQNKHIPYLSTLDILADFVGQQSWTTFCQHNEAEPEVTSDKKLVPDSMGLKLLKICLDNHHFRSVIDYLKMMEGPVLPNLEMHMKLGSTLGNAFRKDKMAQKELLPELARIPEGRFFFYESFVDEDYLNGYYGTALIRYNQYQFELFDNQRIKDFLFGQCMFFYRAFKNHDLPTMLQIGMKLFSIDHENVSIHSQLSCHPVGRWHAYRLAYWHYSDQLDSLRLKNAIFRIEEELNAYHHHHQKLVILEYSMEILLEIGKFEWVVYLYQKHLADLQLPVSRMESHALQMIQAYTKLALLESNQPVSAFDIPLIDTFSSPYTQNKTQTLIKTLKEKESQFL